jgi:hypothetical protein
MIGAYKLNESKVGEIKNLFNTTDLSNGQIAKLYGVSTEHIRAIRRGKRWNDHARSFYMKETLDRWTEEIMLEDKRVESKKNRKNWFWRLVDFIFR